MQWMIIKKKKILLYFAIWHIFCLVNNESQVYWTMKVNLMIRKGV